MKLVYNIATSGYHLLVKLAAPFNKKAALWTKGRQGLLTRVASRLKDNKNPVAWFHCASLGEFEQARPVMEYFSKEFPGYKILITFFSPSGYEIRKNYSGADYIFYLPEDTRRNAERFIDLVNPKLAFFVKYEFWYHYIHTLHQRKIPIISFSAIFRKNQIFFKFYGGFYRNILKMFDKIFVQDESSLHLLSAFGITNAEISGDTRFDRVAEIRKKAMDIPLIEKFKQGKPLLVIGSSWPEDMRVLAPFINSFNDPLKVIIAPHELSEERISGIITALKKSSVRYSQASQVNSEQADVLIIDNIGMLSSLYRYADYAFIGGAFGKGLHNILEAATFGMPLFFGPLYDKFKEARDLVSKSCAFPAKTTEEFRENFSSVYYDDKKRNTIIAESRAYVEKNRGATEIIVRECRINYKL